MQMALVTGPPNERIQYLIAKNIIDQKHKSLFGGFRIIYAAMIKYMKLSRNGAPKEYVTLWTVIIS